METGETVDLTVSRLPGLLPRILGKPSSGSGLHSLFLLAFLRLPFSSNSTPFLSFLQTAKKAWCPYLI